jgi:dUTP pyrophosphatase
MEVKIKYLPGSPKLEKTSIGSWIDLYVYEDTELKSGQRAYISQGVSMQLPEGYEAIIAPRSSTYKRWGLLMTNSIGVVDNAYCGDDDDWKMPVLATRDIVIPKGARICQFRIQKEQPDFDFVEVDHLEGKNRNGLGSSGVF